MSDRITVLVVDDSPFMRRAVQRMLEPLEQVTIVGTAENGREAVEQARNLRPDVVILDIVMPEMNGIQAIREIMEEAPTAILVLSSQTKPGADTTLRALELGAVDFISKSEVGTRMDIYELAPVLRERVLTVANSRVPLAVEEKEPIDDRAPDAPPATSRYEVLAIGASTGGPRALTALLADLPGTFPAGIVIAQHMPPGFTDTLAGRLDRRSHLHVREASDGDPIEPGHALVGIGGRQIRLDRENGRLIVRIPDSEEGLLHRPSVDHLFASVAETCGDRAIGLILTGMGDDGARGLAAIRSAGGRTIAESEESAVIYGMPRLARPAAEQVLPLHRIGPALRRLVETVEEV